MPDISDVLLDEMAKYAVNNEAVIQKLIGLIVSEVIAALQADLNKKAAAGG